MRGAIIIKEDNEVYIMWLILAFGSAFFAGITAILAKIGIKKTDSSVATAIRTIVILLFSWMMVFIVGSQNQIQEISSKTILFLVLSGLATGASWLCYFKALQLGDINKVVPIDKSSTVLTVLLAFIFLDEQMTMVKGVALVLILFGTFLMIQKKNVEVKKNHKIWFLFAVLSAVFASLTSILAKIGIENVDSNLGTALRTGVVLVMAFVVVLATKKGHLIRKIESRELMFILLSGISTGFSWLCYFKALQDGPASVVVPIDKLSILVTIAFSYVVFKEKLSLKAFIGLALIVGGTLLMIL